MMGHDLTTLIVELLLLYGFLAAEGEDDFCPMFHSATKLTV